MRPKNVIGVFSAGEGYKLETLIKVKPRTPRLHSRSYKYDRRMIDILFRVNEVQRPFGRK